MEARSTPEKNTVVSNFIHPYLASLGHTPTAHFKAMFTGYEEVEDDSR